MPEQTDLIEDEESIANTTQFPCQQCGAKLTFAPGTNNLKCEYCSFENLIPQSEEQIVELDFHQYLTEAAGQEEVEEYLRVKCITCAAEIDKPKNVTSLTCPYCDSNIVAEGSVSKHIKPKSILPFVVTREDGRQRFSQWINSLWFAPDKLKKYARQEGKLNGMYVPYWTYDAKTTSFYTGARGIHYYTTESYTTTQNGKSVRRTRQVRRTRWYRVHGTVWHPFDDVLVLASQSLPRDYADRLEPWDLSQLAPYSQKYLSGFRAESYQVDLEEGFDIARGKMDETIRQLIKRDIGGDEQRVTSVKTQHDHVTFKHILLPIWISAYRYQNKVYRILINACTGEVQGERPWSWVKIGLAAIAVIAGIGCVWYTFIAMS